MIAGVKLLSKAGAVVHEAENGLDGLAMMKTQEFAIVLCDMVRSQRVKFILPSCLPTLTFHPNPHR